MRPDFHREPFETIAEVATLDMAWSHLQATEATRPAPSRMTPAALGCLIALVFQIVLPNLALFQSVTQAQPPESILHAATGSDRPPNFNLLQTSQWQDIENTVDQGIDWLVRNQRDDGTYPGPALDQTGISALAAMAMISRGHLPTVGAEGKSINRTIDFILRTQKSSGLLSSRVEDFSGAKMGPNGIMYCHAMAGVLLCEVYGMTDPKRSERIETAIKAALEFMNVRQQREIPANREKRDRGGWRYLRPDMAGGYYSDLSITSWMVMFMRSAENAGFDVPYNWADLAIQYVKRSFDPKTGGFHYVLTNPNQMTRGMTAAGVLCLFLTGNGNERMERAAGTYLRRYPFDRFNAGMSHHDRYFYSCYYCSQAALQLGGETWAVIYPSIARALTGNQMSDGSWQVESHDPWTGKAYSTSMAILALTPPYQLLPIYQR